MQRNKQVVLNVLTVTALLLASIGLLPAAASVAPLPAPLTTVASGQLAAGGGEAAEGLFAAPKPKENDQGEVEGDPNLRDEWFYSRRVAGDPSAHFTMADAATLRAQAAQQTAVLQAQQAQQPTGSQIFSGAWTAVGPNPMVLVGRGDGSFDAMTGRIGALAIRSSAPYTMYLGGAQGGVWTMAYPYTGTWTPKTDNASSLAIGAIALAPSNENIVYVGTGEGALSGDSYFGHGVLKSVDAGNTFSQISAAGYFTNVSISKIVVDKNNPDVLYAGTLRGRGGSRRTSPPDASPFGVWKSTDGGVNWTMVLTASVNPLEFAGITDLAIDPQDSQTIFASLLGHGISKTVNGGVTWTTAMTGLPTNVQYDYMPTRFSLGISRPSAAVSATLYTGFEYVDGSNHYHASAIWKSTNEGNTWTQTLDAGTAPDQVTGYCGTSFSSTQCWYDNVIGVDPISPTIVYAIGLYNYGTGSGGIYRSMDGGDHWLDIGLNLHPDYHAIAIRTDDPTNVAIGNDGGAWVSSSRGGRLSAGDPMTSTTWYNLNGTVGPFATVTHRSGIQLGQYTSIATNPAVPNRFYGGFQDNGTERKSTGSTTWYDVASGDGGQVLVDPTNANYVYGTYYGLSPYRYDDGAGLYVFNDGTGGFTSNEYILNGLHNDRVEFYLPWIMDPGNPNRLYLGTYRVYRTDNAKAVKSSDVHWNLISGDLTSGCTGSAPNGGRACTISALAAPAQSPALYVGTEEGWLWLSTNATSSSPTWNRIDITGTTPMRPVAAIAVDRSNYRVAYVGFNGFSAATPATPGHVFMTTNGGTSWTNISGNLPDVPVNNLLLDQSDPNTLYAGTDVGPYVTHNGGITWSVLGTGFPIVSVEGMDLNPFTRQIAVGTHGRGAWALTDNATLLPALQIGVTDAGIPVGPGSELTYAISVKNNGNITATNVVITNPVPANTNFVSAGSGGTLNGNNVVWTVPAISAASAYTTDTSLGVGVAPGEATITFTVMITSTGVNSGDKIVNDGYSAASSEGPGAVGSPYAVTLAPAHAFAMSPNYQWDGVRSGQIITYLVSVKNLGYVTDSFTLGTAGNSPGFVTTLWDPTFTSLKYTTDPVAAGDSAIVGVKVVINPAVPNSATSTVTVSADSVFNPASSHSAQVKTIAVTANILLVDDDGHGPDVQSYYQNALNAYGQLYNYDDLATDTTLPLRFIQAHKAIVWFAGATYPGNLGPYEANLASFLNGGGRLFVSGWDLLDQNGGTTDFVKNYLHILWDGTDAQNDKGTGSTTAVISNSVTSGLGVLPYTNFKAIGLGNADFSDQLTLSAPAVPAFVDSGTGKIDGMTLDTGTYKAMFLAYPYEAINDTARQVDLMTRTLNWFFGTGGAPTSVAIDGPAKGGVNVDYTFTAPISPITATQPITYTWQATGQTDVVHYGNSTDMVTYNWMTTGTKTITVTANNGLGMVSDAVQVVIDLHRIYMPIIRR